jgi:RimJ/RimL family protein N-acetyltransferase
MTTSAAPRFTRPRSITGRQLVFRDAVVADAEFILGLRTDEQKARYLSTTDADLGKQRAWMAAYAGDDSQIYFIITSLSGAPVGTVRLYDRRGDSFCWGSWIKSDAAPSNFGIESALMVYRYALHLGFTRAHFDVRRENTSVRQFHQRLGATVTGEDAENVYFDMSHEAILQALDHYRKYLPDKVVIA